jgi:hypothetical protein
MIEFQYFEGCPNADRTLANLVAVIKELNLPESEIQVQEIPDLEAARTSNFQGSPTILMNGKDIYTDLPPVGYNFSCRIYVFRNKQTGIIPKDFIKKKFRTYQKENDGKI